MRQWHDIKGILFDLDGVITATARLHSQAWQQIAEQVQAPWTAALQEQLKGIDRMHALDLILQAAGKQAAYSPAEKQQLAAAKNTKYLELVHQLTPTDILPGIRVFLDQLQQHGYQIALASASKNAPTVLHQLGLATFFPEVVDPSTLTQGKPAPEIYLKAASLIGLRPEQCIGIEDAAAGVAAINASGALSVGIGDRQTLAAADVVFASTAELTLPNLRQAIGGVARG
ncbi:MAG: beta-phosphoglucomutase [Lactobacillus sp.]|jgi:beta-phosphoglucomutase|nr:beta-phosphoglucomutase [Lactobacillus sp.]MCI2033033.1 beta-phosphoglucomutase [Lactobacillus sp.]